MKFISLRNSEYFFHFRFRFDLQRHLLHQDIILIDNNAYISLIPEVPENRPSINGIRPRYRPGEIVRGNCTSKNSKPAANLTWTINDNMVSVSIKMFPVIQIVYNLRILTIL